MSGIPNNIVSILAVDNAGATTVIDVASFITSIQNAVNPVAPIISAPVIQKESAPAPVFTTITTEFSIDADINYITKVNKDRTNIVNSLLYENNKKIGVNIITPNHLFDIFGGSLNVTPMSKFDGYKLKNINFAYPNFSVSTQETIVIGDDSLLPRVSIYTLLIRGLALVTSPITPRVLSIDDTGLVSTLSLTSGSVIFSNGIGLVQDNNNFFWDNTNKRLGIGNKVPTESLHVTGSIRQSVVTTAILKADSTGKIVAATDGTDYWSPTSLTSQIVTAKLLTNYTTTGITGVPISSGDTLLQAFAKAQVQINALSISGSTVYKGTWNASTNSPTITSGTGTNGNYYIVSTAGSTTVDGVSTWIVGDWIIFNGTTNVWQKIGYQTVTSVNGITGGAITITTNNITEVTNLYFTNARAIGSTLIGYTSGAGTITSSDTVLSAIQKLNGNIAALVTGVSSVSGTTNRITATPTSGAVVVDIASTYVGQTSITTLGTIATGVWNGTAITDTYISSASTWNAKEPAITSGTTSQYWRGDKTWVALPIYTLSGLGGEPAIAGGTTLQYWRGDKSWQTLPIYTLSSLGAEPAIAGGTTLQYWRGDKSWATLPIYTLSGLGGEPTITAGTTLQYWRGDKTWVTLPIYTLSGLGGEPAITGGTTSQYWRGDKTWATLPIYTLSGLGGEPSITGGTTSQYWRGDKTWATLPVYTLSGLGGVPTTRTLTINGVSYDLSLDRSWTISAISGLTTNKIPKASSSSTLADSSISDDGTIVSSSLPISVTGTITSTSRISASGGGNGSNSGGYYFKYTSNVSSRSWILVNDYSVFGDFALLQSTTQVGTTYAPWIYVNAAGKIGLGGNISPVYAVDITGDLNVAGTIRVNGVAIGTGGGGSITGSGTSGRVALWSGTTSITNSIIRDNGSSVTVGSDNLVYKLSVNPIGTSHFGFGYTGTNRMFLNAVEMIDSQVIFTVPIVYNASIHSWLTGFNLKMELSEAGQLFIGTTGVYGGGTLQVNGDVNITGGQFKIDGVALTSGGGGGGSGNITGSGSNGFITQWNGGTSITNSGIYFNGTNYGIAMTSPNYRLDVNGSINVTGAFYVNGSPIGAGGGGVGGGGTVNKVARWTAGNTLGDSSIYDTGSGSIAIGNTSPSYQIDVTGTIRATGDIIITSDRRKKENIETIENALETIMNLRGVTYNKIDDIKKKKQIGFIAQEVLPHVPEIVYEDNEEYFGVAYQNMVALLTEAIKEQQNQIEELKTKLK